MGINSYVQICIMLKLSTQKIKKQDQLHSHPRKQTIPPKPIKRYTINAQNDQTYEECQIRGVGDDKGNDSPASDSANGYNTRTNCWRYVLELKMSTDYIPANPFWGTTFMDISKVM